MITRHPLYQTADRIKNALMVNGFELADDGVLPEIVKIEQDAVLYDLPADLERKPIILDTQEHILRRTLLPEFLSKTEVRIPLRKFVCGRVFDANDSDHPAHYCIEGVLSGPDMKYAGILELFNRISVSLCGFGAKAEITEFALNCYEIRFTGPGGNCFTFCHISFAKWAAKAILGLEDYTNKTWLFTADVDQIAVSMFGLNGRQSIFTRDIDFLRSFECAEPAIGDRFSTKISDTLRQLGYSEFLGENIYHEDEYMKMHMFQDEWDENNKAVKLAVPFGDRVGLPTVLIPGLEQALGENCASGRQEVRLFEIAHTYLPGACGRKNPREKISLAIGAYAPDMTIADFKSDIDVFLSHLGIRKHFIIKNGVPKAYHREESYLVLNDESMYLGGSLGGINPIAEENYGIQTHAYMANFNIEPLQKQFHNEIMFRPKELP